MLIQNHTAQSLLLTGSQTKADELSYVRPCPCPATISSIDSAIELFSIIYPLQNAQVQEMTLEGFIKTSKTTKAVGPRKVSYQLNVLTALIGFLKHVMMKRGVMASGRVSVAIRDLLEVGLETYVFFVYPFPQTSNP